MGSSESVLKQTSEIVQKTNVHQDATCKAYSEQVTGKVVQNIGKGCLPVSVNEIQENTVNFECDISGTIKQLADMASKADTSTKAALAAALSKSRDDIDNKVTVEQALTQSCSLGVNATQTTGEIDINSTDCTNMNDAQLNAWKDTTIEIHQTQNVGGKCLLSLAAQTADHMITAAKQKSEVKDPLSGLLASFTGLLELGPMLLVGVVAVVVLFVVIAMVRNATSSSGSRDVERTSAQDMTEFRGGRPGLPRHRGTR